jgi:hypothetical protein
VRSARVVLLDGMDCLVAGLVWSLVVASHAVHLVSPLIVPGRIVVLASSPASLAVVSVSVPLCASGPLVIAEACGPGPSLV